MSTVTLSDGTKIPASYDFNEHFEPLVVKNQGQQGICWYETHCTMLEAFWRMYTDLAPTFDPHALGDSQQGWQDTIWTDERFDPPHPLGTTHYIGGDVVTHLDGYKDMPLRDAVCKALWTNGILEGGTNAEASMNKLYSTPWKYQGYNATWKSHFKTLPVLTTRPGDVTQVTLKNNWSHAVIYVGYHYDVGVIFQNSWGSGFGKFGRAIFAWDMLEKTYETHYGGTTSVSDVGFIHVFNDNPANGLKMPAKRAA